MPEVVTLLPRVIVLPVADKLVNATSPLPAPTTPPMLTAEAVAPEPAVNDRVSPDTLLMLLEKPIVPALLLLLPVVLTEVAPVSSAAPVTEKLPLEVV